MTDSSPSIISTNTGSSRTRLPMEDPSTPFFLHPFDGPGLLLVQNKLTSDNYSTWARSMTSALNVKNKTGFINGSLPNPGSENAILQDAWSRNNDIVVSWLLNSVSSSIHSSIIYTNSAKEIWDDLKSRFQQSNGPRVFQLRRDLATISQDTQSVNDYFTKLKSLWDELHTYRPGMDPCTCKNAQKVHDHNQEEYVMIFLMGLNSSYESLREQILIMDPLPPISRVFSLATQAERQRMVGHKNNMDMNNSLAFATRNPTFQPRPYNQFKSQPNNPPIIAQPPSFNPSFKKPNKPTCAHCKLQGHTIDKCFKLHGYPPGFQPKSRQTPTQNSAINQVFDDQTTSQNNHQKQYINFSSPMDQQTNTSALNPMLQSFTNEQCQFLMNLFSSQLTNPTTSSTPISNDSAHISCVSGRVWLGVFAMANQSMRRYYAVGDYMVVKQIGAGSFSTGDSLKSEIFILKRINHPNIIRLHDMIEEPGKIYIILEYCKGGDLSMYLQQRQGRIPEATSKHFMQQLGILISSFLPMMIKVSLKLLILASQVPFSSARSLQPRDLAQTLCGSPLYMAPEIMQLQKYDAKADLWSVGAILFQLVIGKTPFTGSNQIQLLQNIIKSTELQFPPEAKDLSPHCIDLCKKLLRRNPAIKDYRTAESVVLYFQFYKKFHMCFLSTCTVERLTFEEFFNHPYLSQSQPDESFRSRQSQTVLDGFHLSRRNTEESSPEYCLPFSLDNDASGPDGDSSIGKRSTMRHVYGFSLDSKAAQKDNSNLANRTESSKYSSAPRNTEITRSGLGSSRLSEGHLKESFKSVDSRTKVTDSLESIVQDYVIVSGPPMDLSSSARASKTSHFASKTGSPPLDSGHMDSTSSAPLPIIGGATGRVGYTESLESRISAPGTSRGSMDIADTLENSSTDCMARIKSLQRCASAITELVTEKVEGGKQLEAFSVQLVILAIWKQALHIYHKYAASAIEGSPSQESTRLREISKVQHSPDDQESLDIANTQGPRDIGSQIERAFLNEVGNTEELVKVIEPGNMEMPDAMELIYQSALALGKRGAVDEYMGDIENAVVFYSKAVLLLLFLLVEAPSLILNPPFSLTNSDRYRIQNYIDVLNNRQSISRSQRMALFKTEDQTCSS
ncbi:hypothetical protein RD792_014019 [Penstemon davidsonii]|uniref:Protein kinase domain-containing protein n=1 Tax=Penstemon davidsonii TaxID=160366 RepID=A0ABR0CQG5_9LAMI|nr:hypothetical protein RD792_014019 [Penstemon davidsonii]